MRRTFKARGSRVEEVTLTERAAIDLARSVLLTAADLPPEPFLSGDWLCHYERQGGGTHSWEEKKMLRLATDDDRAALRALALLERWANTPAAGAQPEKPLAD